MFVEKKTPGHAPFCTSAPTSVPTPPASSGFTGTQSPVPKPGVEISPPGWVAIAWLCTCQPCRPSVRVPAQAGVAESAMPAVIRTAATPAHRGRTPGPRISPLRPPASDCQVENSGNYLLAELTNAATLPTWLQCVKRLRIRRHRSVIIVTDSGWPSRELAQN